MQLDLVSGRRNPVDLRRRDELQPTTASNAKRLGSGIGLGPLGIGTDRRTPRTHLPPKSAADDKKKAFALSSTR